MYECLCVFDYKIQCLHTLHRQLDERVDDSVSYDSTSTVVLLPLIQWERGPRILQLFQYTRFHKISSSKIIERADVTTALTISFQTKQTPLET